MTGWIYPLVEKEVLVGTIMQAYVIPLCIMWCIWREHNGCSFEDYEKSQKTTLELKPLLLKALYNWKAAAGCFLFFKLARIS